MLIAQALVLLDIALVLIVFDPSAADTFALPKTALANALAFAIMAALAFAIYSGATPETLGELAGVFAVTAIGVALGARARIGRFARAGLAAFGLACAVTAYADGARTALLALLGGAAVTVTLFVLRSVFRSHRAP